MQIRAHISYHLVDGTDIRILGLLPDGRTWDCVIEFTDQVTLPVHVKDDDLISLLESFEPVDLPTRSR